MIRNFEELVLRQTDDDTGVSRILMKVIGYYDTDTKILYCQYSKFDNYIPVYLSVTDSKGQLCPVIDQRTYNLKEVTGEYVNITLTCTNDHNITAIRKVDITEPNTIPSISTTKWDFNDAYLKPFTIPQTSRYKLEVWGSGYSGNGGNGGYSYGEINLKAGEIIYISCGQNDACDIRRNGQELANRIIVAGCGGHGNGGGYGGGLVGGDGGKRGELEGGKGGSQVSGGTGGRGGSKGDNGIFGKGGNCGYIDGSNIIGDGGGGAGYYGGGGGGAGYNYSQDSAFVSVASGGGGSGYIGGVENGQTIPGNQSFPSPTGVSEVGHSGLGYVRITMLNSNPLIEGKDIDLGGKNTGFSISYQVGDKENDSLIVTEKLNGNVLRTLSNAPKGQDLIINITSEQLYSLPLNQQNVITIEVNDGKGGISYRNYTFKRTNTAPVISNTDKDLGVITAIGEKYTVDDMEGNTVTIVEKLDNIILRSFAAVLGKDYTTTIDKDTWIKLRNGKHTYSIEATDSNNSKSTRVFSFTKKELKIDFTLAKPFQTDIKASKILVTTSWELNGATAKIEACNNAFDVNPTWEDITKQVLINRHYNFTNTAKTADKWGINIRIYIEKDPSSVAEVSIKGFGGAFE